MGKKWRLRLKGGHSRLTERLRAFVVIHITQHFSPRPVEDQLEGDCGEQPEPVKREIGRAYIKGSETRTCWDKWIKPKGPCLSPMTFFLFVYIHLIL